MLFTFFLSPLISAVVLLLLRTSLSKRYFQNISLILSLIILNFSVVLLFFFDPLFVGFQLNTFVIYYSQNYLVFAVDGFALIMLILTAFLTSVCILLSWNPSVVNKSADYICAYFFLECILFGVFLSVDLTLFYVFFEAVLIPMFLIIGLYGSRERRMRASYLLFLYTLFSSIFMLLAILYLFYVTGTTNLIVLKSIVLDNTVEKVCWLCFFASFSVKMPFIPFHIWLPEAHCEAPTSGSVILAGVLLKLGGFGFLRFSIGLFPEASAFFTPLIFTVCVFGIIYGSVTTLQQVDLKKIVAYSSISHMGVVGLGLFSANNQGILGSMLLMISHAIVSSALFICIGVLYERYHTRIIKYYSGLVHTMPLFSVYLLLFSFANISFPSTNSFVGEFLILLGCFINNPFVALTSGLCLVLCASYTLWFVNRVLFGNPKKFSFSKFKDISRYEFHILCPFLIATFYFGLFPEHLILYLTLY